MKPFLKLFKTLYCSVEAPSLWFEALSKALHSQGFKQFKAYPCLFTHKEKKSILTYVDDCLLF